MERNSAIDAVKGFAILLVMVGHCIVLNGLHASDPYIYDGIKSVQMPLFMLVSGVVASYSLRKNGKGSGMKKLPQRAISYLVPFFSWFILVYLWTHILSGNLSFGGFMEELKLLLFQTDRGLWFLMTLFVVTLCVMIAQAVADKIWDGEEAAAKNIEKTTETNVEKVKKKITEKGTKRIMKKMWTFLLVSCVFYGLFFFQSRSGNTFLSPALTVQYFPFYLLGYVGNGYLGSSYVADWFSTQNSATIRRFGCGALLLSFVVFLWLVIAYDLTAPVDGIKTLALQMLASLLGTVSVYGIVYKVAEKQKKKKGILSFVGMYTLEIYVLHFRFARMLGLAEKGLEFYSVEGLMWLVAAFGLMAALTALSICLVKKVKILDFILFGKIENKK